MALANHLKKVHQVGVGVRECAVDQYKTHISELNETNEESRNSALSEYDDIFRECQKRGPKKANRITYTEKYHCYLCNISYATSLTAMVSHAKKHRADEYMKIYKNSNGDLKPEENLHNKTTGLLYAGGNTKLHSVAIPKRVKNRDGKLICRCRDQV